MKNSNSFEFTKKAIEDRNTKLVGAFAAGAVAGVGITALSPKSSVASTAITAAYVGTRVYLINEQLKDQVNLDVLRSRSNPKVMEASGQELATTALIGLADATAIGYLSSYFLGNN